MWLKFNSVEMPNNFINPITKNPITVMMIRTDDFFARFDSKTTFEIIFCDMTAFENSFL